MGWGDNIIRALAGGPKETAPANPLRGSEEFNEFIRSTMAERDQIVRDLATLSPRNVIPEGIDGYSKRTYDAAIPSGTTADWLAWATSGSYEVLNAWRRITYLARDLERNNPHTLAFLRDLTTNVIGKDGIQLAPKVKNQKGGNLNNKTNARIKEIWRDWNKRGNCDVTGQYSGNQADRLILRALARDGGCLIRLFPGFNNNHRFAIQYFEIDALDIWYNQILTDKSRVTTGVEVDQWGKPVAYHLIDYAQADLMANNTVGKRTRVPADQIIHVWLPQRFTEVRGMSWFSPVMVKLRMLDKFEEAIAIAQRVSASKMGFYVRKEGSEKFKGQGQTSTGEMIQEVSPGLFSELPEGYDFKTFDPSNPTESYKDFKKEILRSVCAGLGDQYNALANDLESVNYSSARFGRDIAVENWTVLQHFYIETVKQRILEKLLEMSVMTGELDVPMSQIDDVHASMTWRPRGFPNVDPQKDAQASIAKISFGLSTRSRELAEEGLDFEEVCAELSRENEIAEKYGLTFIDPTSRAPYLSSQEDSSATPGNTDVQQDEANKQKPLKSPATAAAVPRLPSKAPAKKDGDSKA